PSTAVPKSLIERINQAVSQLSTMQSLFAVAFLAVIFVAVLPSGVDCITLNDARADPDRYILYDTTQFHIGMHCGISLVICYAILCAIWLTIMGVIYATGGKKMRRQAS
ncbi:hypothetical protein BOX15_Mlig000783g2, partial [Macrostomum lignano]